MTQFIPIVGLILTLGSINSMLAQTDSDRSVQSIAVNPSIAAPQRVVTPPKTVLLADTELATDDTVTDLDLVSASQDTAPQKVLDSANQVSASATARESLQRDNDVELALKNEIAAKKMPKIDVDVSPKKASIGQRITWKVTVSKKSIEDRVVLPSALDFGKLDIQSRDLDSPDEVDKMHQTLAIHLLGFTVGEVKIPPQKLTVVDDEGNISEVMTPSFSVTIQSLIENEPEPALKASIGKGEVVMVKDYTLLYVGAGLLGVMVIALLTLLIRKLWSLRNPKPEPAPPPSRPAHEIALEKLNALKLGGYLEERMHKVFHLKLSEAFREYLGNRYGFDSLERSTMELIDDLTLRSLKLELHREIVTLLEDTDLVKFAKYEPSIEHSQQLLDEAFRIVEITTQAVLLPPDSSEAIPASSSNKHAQDNAVGGEK